MNCLSLRQPWPWFIFRLPPSQHKDIENRDWPCPRSFFGNVMIHASQTMTKREYEDGCEFALKAGATLLPDFDRLKRGGIVGIVKITGCVTRSDSPWFVGRFGFVLKDAYPLPFLPLSGERGFFKFSAGIYNGGSPPPSIGYLATTDA